MNFMTESTSEVIACTNKLCKSSCQFVTYMQGNLYLVIFQA